MGKRFQRLKQLHVISVLKNRLTVMYHWYGSEIYLIPTIRFTRHRGEPSRFGFTIFFLGWRFFIRWEKSVTPEEFKTIIENNRKNESKTV